MNIHHQSSTPDMLSIIGQGGQQMGRKRKRRGGEERREEKHGDGDRVKRE